MPTKKKSFQAVADKGLAPFLKWPGGKRRLVPALLGYLPSSIKRLVEPFCGGCALSLAVGDRAERFWLNDINPDLVNLLRQIKGDPVALIELAKTYFTPATNTAEAYYRLREEFNRTEDPLRRAALFIYLNRHGYNGLCRYNDHGGFNVPFGRYRQPYFPEKEILAAAALFARAAITALDFEEVLEACGPGDVVYCDPPYVPLSPTASFTAYAAGGFGRADQERLAKAAARAASRGALVVISNHDTPLTRELYKEAELKSLDVRRNISCNGANRAVVREIIAVYVPTGVRAE